MVLLLFQQLPLERIALTNVPMVHSHVVFSRYAFALIFTKVELICINKRRNMFSKVCAFQVSK